MRHVSSYLGGINCSSRLSFGTSTFYLYITVFSSVINSRQLSHRHYADDTHVYVSLCTSDANCSLQQRRSCIDDVLMDD